MPGTPTPRNGWPTLAPGDILNAFPGLFNDFAAQVDADASTVDTSATRPAAGIVGRWHLSTAGILSFDTGTSWIEVAQQATVAAVEIGVEQFYAGSALPDPAGDVEYRWCDGSLLVGIGVGEPYREFFNRVGHAYNGGVDPGGNAVRLPDKRSRMAVGADVMGTGAAGGRMPNHNRARGQAGGLERELLADAQVPLRAHGHGNNISFGVNDPGHDHNVRVAMQTNRTTVQNNFPMAMLGTDFHTFDINTSVVDADPAGTGITLSKSGAVTDVARVAPTSYVSKLAPYEVSNMIVRVR